MEASKQYCSGEETFSYRWLVTLDSYSLAVADGDDDDDDDTAACSFIEMDPAAAASTRWTIDVNGFHFATAAGIEPPSFPYPSLPPPPPPPLLNSKPTSLERSGTNSKPKSTVLIHGAASLKRILWTYYLCLLVPLRNKVKGLSSAIPKKAAARNKRCGRSASSGGSRTGGGIEWCRSNADVSVYDAILHCKKSYGSL